MIDMKTIIEHVFEANPDRTEANLNRRIFKLFEELGELSEAYLASTSSRSYKNKTWNDVREEAADVLIVALDIALTPSEEAGIDGNFKTLLNSILANWPLPTFDYDLVFLDIASMAAVFGKHGSAQARVEMVLCAFSLTDLVFGAGDVQGRHYEAADLLSEIDRKLTKWKNNRQSNKVMTDAE